VLQRNLGRKVSGWVSGLEQAEEEFGIVGLYVHSCLYVHSADEIPS
jgi:hypothetical protein